MIPLILLHIALASPPLFVQKGDNMIVYCEYSRQCWSFVEYPAYYGWIPWLQVPEPKELQ